MLVIGSPLCTYFSTLQELNKFNQRSNYEWLARFNDNFIKATNHIKCCITLYRMQMDKGRYWLHKHPWSAKLWHMPDMEELFTFPTSFTVRASARTKVNNEIGTALTLSTSRS